MNYSRVYFQGLFLRIFPRVSWGQGVFGQCFFSPGVFYSGFFLLRVFAQGFFPRFFFRGVFSLGVFSLGCFSRVSFQAFLSRILQDFLGGDTLGEGCFSDFSMDIFSIFPLGTI